MILRSIVLILLVPAALHAEEPMRTFTTQEAVALADSTRHDTAGRFAMTVRGSGHDESAVFLNSGDDYRSSDNLTIRIPSYVAKSLAKRFGQDPETYFRDKHLVVDGTIRRELIVNKSYGRVVSANRWQHVIRILRVSQIVSIS